MIISEVIKVNLNLIQDIKDFVNISSKHTGPIAVRSMGYEVDGKSILGVLSLDLTKPVEVKVSLPDSEKFFEEVKRFTV